MTQSRGKVFDLFAGAGGFGLGFELAGFSLNLSLEKDAWAAQTLRANSRDSNRIILEKDIRELNCKDSILAVSKGLRPDLIIGGPPCQGFSLAGPIKDPADPRNTLFTNFAKWVEVLTPSVFVMENVPGILGRKNEEGNSVIKIIVNTFRDLGYHVEIWRLNAMNYGVPQSRERVFIVGNLFGHEIGKPVPTHGPAGEDVLSQLQLAPFVTVGEAIGDLPYIEAGEGEEVMAYINAPSSEYQSWARENSTHVNNHVSMVHTKRVVERYRHLQQGYDLANIPDTLRVRKRNGNGQLSETQYHSNYRHLKENQISYTIPASFYSTFIHPFIPRNITSREAARLQSFPDTYVFRGKRTMISAKLQEKRGLTDQNNLSQYNQIGNAVPPRLAYHIAQRIDDFLKNYRGKLIPIRHSNVVASL